MAERFFVMARSEGEAIQRRVSLSPSDKARAEKRRPGGPFRIVPAYIACACVVEACRLFASQFRGDPKRSKENLNQRDIDGGASAHTSARRALMSRPTRLNQW